MRFHVLDGVVGSEAETWFEPVGEPKLGDAPRCPECGRWVGMKLRNPPYVVRLRVFGGPVGDVAFDMASDDLLVSSRFVSAWNTEGLRGLEWAEEVSLKGLGESQRASQVGPYFLVRPARTGTRIDALGSQLVRAGPETCALCGGADVEAILSLRIDETSWRGEDIFIPWGLAAVTVVTERVVSLAAAYELRNVTTTPIEGFQREFRPGR
jgi:hypothetical protein